MRKNFLKKLCVAAMAVVMTVGSTMSAMAADYTAALSYADKDWNNSVWGDSDEAKVTVSGPGTYTVSHTVSAAATGAVVFVIDIGEENGNAATDLSAYDLTDVTLKVDGTEVDVALAKIKTGDIEGKGRYRIEIYNEYGETKNDSPIVLDTFTINSKLEVSFTLTDPNAETTSEETTPAETTTAGGTDAEETTTAATGTGTPSTGDTAMVGLFVALAAVSAVVVLKKRTVTE